MSQNVQYPWYSNDPTPLEPIVRSTQSANPGSLPETLKPYEVLDIGGSSLPDLLSSMMHNQLVHPDDTVNRHLPALFFSDDKGLEMWRDITHLPNYYQTRDEIEMLERNGEEIIAEMGLGKRKGGRLIVIDLGAGDVRKVVPLLEKLDRLNRPIVYLALDLSETSLKTAMATLSSKNFKYVVCHGLWGCFDSGIEFIHTLPASVPRLFMSLGSMFGNDYFKSAVTLLAAWREEMRSQDRMLIGMDGTSDRDTIWKSYHDDSGLFEKFIRNGMEFSNAVVGEKWFDSEDWTLDGFIDNEGSLMHKFIFTSKRAVKLPTSGGHVMLPVGEKIEGYRAFKLSRDEMTYRFIWAGLKECNGWTSATGRIHQYLLKPATDFEHN